MTKDTLTPRARQILRLLHRTDGLSRAALIRETGLSGTAIFRASEELEAAGLVRIGGAVAEGRGQPSAMIHPEAQAVLGLGLSIMTDRADVVLIDLSGRVVAQQELTIPGMPRTAILEATAQFARDAAVRLGLPFHRIAGMGLAIAGNFMAADMVNPGFELDDWALIELRTQAQERLGLPVVVENIANAAAVGEHLLGAGARFNSFAYINVAAGFGGGMVIDRRLMRGWMGNAGEIAGMFDLFGRPRPNLVSLQEVLACHGVACDSIADLVARFDMAWPGVEEWLDVHGPAFSLLFNALRMVLDTEAIILGGRLPRALAHRILAAHRWREEEIVPRRSRAAPFSQLCVAELAPELSAPLGAASLILERELFH